MMRKMALRSMLGRSGTTMMYVAAAGAMYAWRTRNRRRRGATQASTISATASHRDEGAEGDERDVETRDRWRDDPSRHGAIGITGLPPEVEEAQQASLPERGTRKPGVHA